MNIAKMLWPLWLVLQYNIYMSLAVLIRVLKRDSAALLPGSATPLSLPPPSAPPPSLYPRPHPGRPPGEGGAAPGPAEAAAPLRLRLLRARGVCTVRYRALSGHGAVWPRAKAAATGSSGETTTHLLMLF